MKLAPAIGQIFQEYRDIVIRPSCASPRAREPNSTTRSIRSP
jgi:hypothetical protein